MLLFKDPKSSVWFTLGSEDDETMLRDTSNYFLSSTAGQGFQVTGSPIFSVNFTNRKNIQLNQAIRC